MKKIALFGGSFNPSGIHHLKIAKEISLYFNEVIIFPCGLREEKGSIGCISPIHRQKIIELTFSGLPKIKLDFSDIDKTEFTPTWLLQERFGEFGNLFHVVGTDLIDGGSNGKSEIQTIWKYGEEIWKEFNFFIIKRLGYQITPHDLPPKFQLLEPVFDGSSSEIRERLLKENPINGLVTDEVEKYIYKNGLYIKKEVKDERKKAITIHNF